MTLQDVIARALALDVGPVIEGAVVLLVVVMVLALTFVVAGIVEGIKADSRTRNLPAPDHRAGRDYAAFHRRSFGGTRRNSRNHWVA